LQRAIQIWKITEADGVSQTNKTNRPDSTYRGILTTAGPNNPKHILQMTCSSTGMKHTDNKFNHIKIDCKPNNITDSEQLSAQSANTRRKRNPQSKQEAAERKHEFAQNKSSKDVNREHRVSLVRCAI
jgi:hypothetical protein